MPFNRLNHSILGQIRPRFVLKIQVEPEIALNQVEKSVLLDNTVTYSKSHNLIFLKIPVNIQHYWSPEMTVRIEKSEYSNLVSVNCLIGPRQSVWAMFALINAALLILTVFGSMFGIVQYQTSGASPWIWLFPIGIICLFLVFLTSKIGQKKGRDQMLHLVSFLYHSLSEISSVERIEKK